MKRDPNVERMIFCQIL